MRANIKKAFRGQLSHSLAHHTTNHPRAGAFIANESSALSSRSYFEEQKIRRDVAAQIIARGWEREKIPRAI